MEVSIASTSSSSSFSRSTYNSFMLWTCPTCPSNTITHSRLPRSQSRIEPSSLPEKSILPGSIAGIDGGEEDEGSVEKQEEEGVEEEEAQWDDGEVMPSQRTTELTQSLWPRRVKQSPFRKFQICRRDARSKRQSKQGMKKGERE
jgi:hypothetical protein